MTTAVAAPGHDVGERLYLPGDSLVHRLPAHVKLVAAISFVFIVVATPPQYFAAFAGYALLLVAVLVVARLPLRRVLPRLLVETPFVVFALLLPFVGRPPEVEVAGFALSEPGLLAAWNILAKATLGIGVSITVAATTRSRDLLDGLARLRVPSLLVEIASFMLRYVQVVSDQWHRMSLARASRGFATKGVRSWPIIARSMGTLFIRSYERGERVHLAMLSRGYTGSMPLATATPAAPAQWATALALPVAAALVLTVALL